MLNKAFHIYKDSECLHHNIDEDTFNRLWEYYHMEGVTVQYISIDDMEMKVTEEASY